MDDPGTASGLTRRRFGTVRVRTTAAAVVVVGVALALGALGLVMLLRRSLSADVRTAAQLRATDVAGLLAAGTPPAGLAVSSEEDQVVQVLDQAGRVVAASPNIAGEPPIAKIAPGRSHQVSHLPVDEGHDFLAVSVPADIPGGGRGSVLVGRSLRSVESSVGRVIGLLGGGLPLLLIVVGVTTWRVVGRALAPVEAIRAEVDAISATQMHRRVPDPPGHDEISRLAATMNRMLRRLEEAQGKQRRFVSDASHELRSPVAIIRQHAEVALAHPGRTQTEDLAGVVLAEDLRLQRLVENLLWLARADERTLSVSCSPVDLDDLVLAETTRLRATTTLRIDGSGVSAARVSGDAAQLHRLVRNLADNAARHARAAIALSVGMVGDTAVLDIDDDGPGIAAAERHRVFDRFVRLDGARARDHGGSGLGLAIVAQIAGVHGGSVTVGDAPLGGARLELRLPLLDDTWQDHPSATATPVQRPRFDWLPLSSRRGTVGAPVPSRHGTEPSDEPRPDAAKQG